MNIIDQVKAALIEEISASIRKAELVDDIPEIKVEIPKDDKNGDYSTNIAMVLTKLARRNPARSLKQSWTTSIRHKHTLKKSISLDQVSLIST